MSCFSYKRGYRLKYIKIIQLILREIKAPNDELIDTDLFDNTEYYLMNLGNQICITYRAGTYDGCLALIRKLLETLIIECFERYNIDELIKNSSNFLPLSHLIIAFENSPKWNASRNIRSSFKRIKKYGDLSAHNRRFIAKKSDIDRISDDFRQAIQEIILTIDYPTWDRK